MKKLSPLSASATINDRRSFLKATVAAALAAGHPLFGESQRPLEQPSDVDQGKIKKPPNIVMICADQMRADFVGAYKQNPDVHTPNLNSIAARGTSFSSAVTNQPLCSPSRACMITGRYATEAGPWRLTLGLNEQLPTLASVLRKNGYTANLIGKWHLAPIDRKQTEGFGFVPPEHRGGFLDLWEGANAIEITSDPYKGTIWDGAGNKMEFQNEYRVQFLTDLAVKFLRKPQKKPFLLYLSHLEPHHQNNLGRVVAPKGYAEKYENPFVPPDLKALPGAWQEQLPDYYGAVQSIDESVGRVLKTLDEQGLTENTIVCFLSDHGSTFRTRRGDWKRNPQDSSIRIPFLFQGPGFDSSLQLQQVVSMIDFTTTLLDAAGVPVPSSMKGKSLMPLIHDPEARRNWKNLAYIQLSEDLVGRAIRTDEWLYCVADPNGNPNKDEMSSHYQEYVLYNLFSDPSELLNLVGHHKVREISEQLKAELLNCMREAGEPPAQIERQPLYV